MNERIDDLMYQAGLTAQGCLDKMDDYDREAILKFAELIVRECCNIVNQEALHTDYIPAEMNQYVFNRLMKAFDKIEEHFGVEP